MVLIPKGEMDTTNQSNYRPISLLENIEKILERIINERLLRHLEDNELLNLETIWIQEKKRLPGSHSPFI